MRNLSLLLTTIHTVKSKGKISLNFVAFSEYMNFKFKTKIDRIKKNSPLIHCDLAICQSVVTSLLCSVQSSRGNTFLRR